MVSGRFPVVDARVTSGECSAPAAPTAPVLLGLELAQGRKQQLLLGGGQPRRGMGPGGRNAAAWSHRRPTPRGRRRLGADPTRRSSGRHGPRRRRSSPTRTPEPRGCTTTSRSGCCGSRSRRPRRCDAPRCSPTGRPRSPEVGVVAPVGHELEHDEHAHQPESRDTKEPHMDRSYGPRPGTSGGDGKHSADSTLGGPYARCTMVRTSEPRRSSATLPIVAGRRARHHVGMKLGGGRWS